MIIRKSLALTTSRPLSLSELRELVTMAERETMSPDAAVRVSHPENHLIEIVISDVAAEES